MSMLSEQRDTLRKVAGELQSIIDSLNKGRITYDVLMDTLNYGIQCLNGAADTIWKLRNDCVDLRRENIKLRELFEKTYGYYVSGTLTPCDFCWRTDCEGPAPTTCEVDEYEPDGIVTKEIERLMRELGIEVE